MSSLIIDLILCGVAYVILIYFVATLTKNSLRRGDSSGDDGDGQVPCSQMSTRRLAMCASGDDGADRARGIR